MREFHKNPLEQYFTDEDREHFTIGEVAHCVEGNFNFKCIDNSCGNGCPSCCFYTGEWDTCYGPCCEHGDVIFEKCE